VQIQDIATFTGFVQFVRLLTLIFNVNYFVINVSLTLLLLFAESISCYCHASS